jgi:hypothetical protein
MGLFTPAWKSKNEERALRAVRKMTSQKKLAKVVKNSEHLRVPVVAVKKLTNQTLLADIAKSAKDWYVRKAATEKLTDQTLLADIAKNDSHADVRNAAVEKLTDQSLLADVAKKDSNEYVRKAAVEKLTDQTVLADIAENEWSSNVRNSAVEKLTDQTLLADIAKNASVSDVLRKAAVEKLTDQTMLADIAKNNSVSNIRKTAIKKLDDAHLGDLLDYYISRFGNNSNIEELLFICSCSNVLTQTRWMKISEKLKNIHQDSPHRDSGGSHSDYSSSGGVHLTPTGHWSSSDCEHTDNKSNHTDIRHNDFKGEYYLNKFPPYIKD